MIIIRAPYRLSLAGGGSDYPEFIAKHRYGSIVSAAINKYAYVCIKKLLPFHPYQSKITYDKRERVYSSNKYISHPIFRNCINFIGLENEPLEINFISDVPGGSGLGTGSTMIVCLLKALYEYKKENISDKDLLNNAFYIERNLIGEPAGIQDYLPAIYGGMRYYELKYSDKISLNHIDTFPVHYVDYINSNGLLFYTGVSRKSSVVINKYLENIVCEPQKEIRYLAEQMYVMMKDSRSFDSFVELINLGQSLKEKVSPAILTDDIKIKMDLLRKNGIKAIRLLGAGGGGSIFCLAKPDQHYTILEKAREAGLIHIPFRVAERGIERIL